MLRLMLLLSILALAGCTSRSDKNSNKDADQPRASGTKPAER